MNNFIRIGTEYYKIVNMPINETETEQKMIPWKKQTIMDDFGKDYLKTIDTYEGFVSIPSHTNYKAMINGFYNQYESLDHKTLKGEFPNTLGFIKHIFGDQLELGLDYISILWHYPKQILPILSLVSNERNTGKTTFLNWLKLIFKGNMTINKNEDFRSRFNSDWAGKIIIAVDEVLLDRMEDSERIKNLSTSQYYKSESKGKDKMEIPFYGKFILCSNNEENFIKVDPNEIRYWVRKVPVLNNSNPNLMQILEGEIPFFINFLNERKIITPKISRMWFSPKSLKTDALAILVGGNKTNLEKELVEILSDRFINFEEDILEYTAKDLSLMLKESGIMTQNNKISRLLKDKWNLESKNNTYKMYHYSSYNSLTNSFHDYTTCKGRFFTFTKVLLEKL